MFSFLLNSCDSLFYYPSKKIDITPAELGFKYEDLKIKTQDQETLNAWHIKSGIKRLGTIIHFHGNAHNMSSHVRFVSWLVPFGFDVISFDYRGYGRSTGTPTRKGLYIDAVTILEHFKDVDELFVIGQSLGGAVSIPAIAKVQPKHLKAVIIDSSFSSYRGSFAKKAEQILFFSPIATLLSYLVGDDYNPLEYAEKIIQPTLLLHGDKDRVVPYSESQELQKYFPNVEFWTHPDADHTQSFMEAYYQRRIVDWICSKLSEKRNCS